jgi:hypothetical protein
VQLSTQTNGICERFHRTVQDEFYSVAFRKRLYSSLEQLQADVDAWIREYNEVRSHSGKYCFGKTPMQHSWVQSTCPMKSSLTACRSGLHRTLFLRAMRARLWHSHVSDQV